MSDLLARTLVLLEDVDEILRALDRHPPVATPWQAVRHDNLKRVRYELTTLTTDIKKVLK